MSTSHPKPGNGYTIREYLGGGAHKKTYRASSVHQARDVALIYFRKDDPSLIAGDFDRLMRIRRNTPNAEYVAQLIGFNIGDDGKAYLIEELLGRSLEDVAPIDDDLIKFSRIARDLFKGLDVLHSVQLVHRDLKLDNCGVDSQGRAKIFDLGCVTTDRSYVQGHVFTREPSLLLGQKFTADTASDVWAMAATLLALRTHDYPFVTRADVQTRNKFDRDNSERDEETAEAIAFMAALEKSAQAAAAAPNAEVKLISRLAQHFRGDALELMKGALVFDSESRLTAASASAGWTILCDKLAHATAPRDEDRVSKTRIEPMIKHELEQLTMIESFLARVCNGEVSITEKQLQRTTQRLAANIKSRSTAPFAGLEQIESKHAVIKKLVGAIKRRKLFADRRLKAISNT